MSFGGWLATILSQSTQQVKVNSEPISLNLGGWMVMILSVSSVLALVIYCVYTVLSLPSVEEEHIKGPLKIDTRDTQDAD